MIDPANHQPESEIAATPIPGGDEWLSMRPALRSDLRFEIRRTDTITNYVIEDSTRRKFFQIGAQEFNFVQMLDGKTEVRVAIEQIQKHSSPAESITEEAAKRIVQWLIQLNLVQTECMATSDRIVKAKRQQKTQRLLTFINPLMFKVRLMNPDRQLAKLLPWTGWIFSRWALAGWIILVVCALTQMLQHTDRLATASNGILANGRWIWLIVCWALLKVVHEMGHGIACKKFGGEANETGVLMLLFTPMAYIDVSSSWRFASRKKRMVVSAAGMYVEIAIAAAAMIVWCQTSSQLVADICFNLYLMAGITTILFNANPLMRFDGYYLLSDGIGIINLYTRGQTEVQNRFRKVFGLPAETLRCRNATNVTIMVYGLLAFLWRITISIGLVIGATTLLSGFGLMFAFVGIVLWFLFPVYRFLLQIYQGHQQKVLNHRRLLIAVTLLILIGGATFSLIKAPALKSAPAIVQFKDERILRSGSDGFLKKVHVINGQYVTENQLLFELENDGLNLEIANLELEIQQTSIQARIFQQKSDLASLQAEQEKLRSLKSQLIEKMGEAESLEIRAPFDGIVFSRNMDDKIGIFLKRGDDLATVAQSANKEILVSIDQMDWKSFEQGEGKPVKLGFPGVRILSTTLDRVNPRASDKPIDVTLTAAYGGPIAVRNNGSLEKNKESVVMLGQRFSATIHLDDEQSQQFQAGQRGVIYFRTPRQSLGSYLLVACQNWLRKKLQVATRSSE